MYISRVYTLYIEVCIMMGIVMKVKELSHRYEDTFDDDLRNVYSKGEINRDDKYVNNHSSSIINVAKLGKTDVFDLDFRVNNASESTARMRKRKDEAEVSAVLDEDVFDEEYSIETDDEEFFAYGDGDF